MQIIKGATFPDTSGDSALIDNKISECYEHFITQFLSQIDFYFQTYNRNLRGNNLEVHLKGTKKEKLRHMQFLVHEEKEYWKEFPRKLESYNEFLRSMQDLFKEIISAGGLGVSRDVTLIIYHILNVMPIASKKYCIKIGIDPVFKQEKTNKIYFENLAETIKMFDADDQKNWLILGFTVTIFVSDLILLLLETYSPRQLTDDLIEILLDICRHFSRVQNFTDEGIEEDTILDIYFKQIQVNWAKIFGTLSKISLEMCMKFMNDALLQDFKKMSDDDIQVSAQLIYFCRFLQITPSNITMASHIGDQLSSMCKYLGLKYIPPQMKNVLLMTLKYLVEQLQFYFYSEGAIHEYNSDSPMGNLWKVVEAMFDSVEKCRKKEYLKDYALQLLIVIMKVSPNDFFNDKIMLMVKSQKIQGYLETKKTYNHGLQLIMEICCPRATPLNKYQNWNPLTQARTYLLLEDKSNDVVLPIKQYKRHQKFKLTRRLFPSEIIPIPFRESFKLIFNPKVLPELSSMHFQYLQQMSFEDLDFTITQVIPNLLSYLKTQDRYDVPLLALRLMAFILDPLFDYKKEYLKLWPQQSKFVEQAIKNLHSYACITIKEILRSPLLKSDFLLDLHNFYKSDDKELCNDQLSIVWSVQNNGDEELAFRRATTISQSLKNKGLATFYLQEEKRVISFEEFKEIQLMSTDVTNEYQNDNLNQIAKAIAKEMAEWDFKKERFIRHRISSYLSEERKEGSRQNTSHFGISASKKEEIKLLKQVLKMIHYLPEVQDYYKYYPLKRLLVDEQTFLTNKAPEHSLSEFDDDSRIFSQLTVAAQTQNDDQIAIVATNLRSRRKSGGTQRQQQSNPKLREGQYFLPYLLMSAEYSIVATASQQIFKLVIYGDFKTKIALVDQMMYFIKELMLEAPDEFLIVQMLQQLIKMIKIWHSSEKNKVIIHHKFLETRIVENLEILSMNPFTDNNMKKVNIADRMVNYKYIFDAIDMLALLGINNKDKLVRQLSIILMAENGKLKRLLIPINTSKREDLITTIYDIIYYNTEELQKQIISKMIILNSFKSGEFKSFEEMTKLISNISPYQLIVDSFDYKKQGVSESFVRDMQIILMGEIFIQWKSIIIDQPTSQSILNFINTISQRTLSQFETKSESEATLHKDYLGLNLLMAIILFNVSHSHHNLHINHIQTENSSENIDSSSQISSVPQILSTNSVWEEFQNLVSFLSKDISYTHKDTFGKFYPPRFTVSSVLLAFLYRLQVPYDGKSIENLKEIFQIDLQNKEGPFFTNCLLFYTLLTENANPRFTTYITHHKNQLAEFTQRLSLFTLNQTYSPDQQIERKQKVILLITYLHTIVIMMNAFYKKEQYAEIKKIFRPRLQFELMTFTKEEHDRIELDQKQELAWLLPKIKQIWHTLLSFELIFGAVPNIKLDLKFLISLESQGYVVLKYYKYLNNPNQSFTSGGSKQQKNLQQDVQQDFNINELKHLLNQVYMFYDIKLNPTEQILKKNPYYKCFLSNIVGVKSLLAFITQQNFNQVYGQLTSSCLRSKKALIEAKIKQFISYGLHHKYFLLGLFMSLNSVDKKVIEDSKILCLSVLPLMFEDEKFRESIESLISEHDNISRLVQFDNRDFYRLIKQILKQEETFNMRHHFEKYFSISGLMRNILNEIIKLDVIPFNKKMLLKTLDIITYFIGNIQLRRAPVVESESSSFIFDNLIDYKSFEFLSKLYKISEKLVDFDDESTVMNMWYKVVEGKIQNFEILAKFLVHNLSSFIMKLKGENKEIKETEYSLEYEKQKRYSLSIFNYIKSRTQSMDIMNSINLSENSITWSQKMIRLMTKAAVNLQSKYVLEKLKLKKILQLLHSEINECGVRLQLKGGLTQSTELINTENQRISLNMSDLLSSKTFLETFSAKNRKHKTIMKNLIFRMRRIMNEKFSEIASQKSIDQMSEMIIKYFENSLVFITNEADRPAQKIHFTSKEELSIIIVMIVLTVDLITKDANENRFYFLLEIFNKLKVHVPKVQNYFNFKNFATSTIFSRDTKVSFKLQQVVNLKASSENFPLYTKLHFKIISNLNSAPMIQYHLIRMWLIIFQKHKESQTASSISNTLTTSIAEMLQMKAQEALMYSRNLILILLQNSFFNISEISHAKKEISLNDMKYSTYNFKQHFNCILDYVIPTSGMKMQQIKSNNDPESVHVAFATNSIFWIAYSCLECASQITEVSLLDLSTELQTIGMNAINKVLEKSDFLKMLIGVSKLSQNFFSYSLSMSKRQSSFLSLIFDSLENPNCLEDSMKSLIITIRVQDQQLLNASNKREIAEIELQRLLYLIPYLMQQFTNILENQINPGNLRQPIFGTYRSIILLLKKSLPSLGIDKKKDVFEQLDLIQKEAERNEEMLTKKEFEGLLISTISLCNQLGYQSVIFDCERTFTSIQDAMAVSKTEPVINIVTIQMVLKVINAFITTNQLVLQIDRRSVRELLSKDLIDNIYTGDILGEEASAIKLSLRPLYFGLKNIILKEIQSIDMDIDINKFFFDQSAQDYKGKSLTSSFQSQSIMPNRQVTGLLGVSQNQTTPPQIGQEPVEFQNIQQDFTQVYKKISMKKNETASKYQNSSAKPLNTPSDKRITELYGGGIISDGEQLQRVLSSSKIITSKYLNQPLQLPINHQQQMLLDDDDIYTPVLKQMSSIATTKKALDSYKFRLDEDGLGGLDDEILDYPYTLNNKNSEYYEHQSLEQFEVIQEEDNHNGQNNPNHSESSEDPRERLKRVIENNKKIQMLSVSPLKRGDNNEGFNINPILLTKQSISFQDRVQQSKNIIYHGDAGGIVTFSKPKNLEQKIIQSTLPNKDQQFKLQKVLNPIEEIVMNPNYVAKEIVMNPNYVADRTSQIFSEIFHHSQEINMGFKSQQNFYREPDSMMIDDCLSNNPQSVKKRENPLSQYPWLQEAAQQDHKMQLADAQSNQNEKVKTRANNFFETPTSKKQPNKLESRLKKKYLSDKKKLFGLEKFLLNKKQYDIDNLHFYLKVMEFQQESNFQKAFLIAGIIIDMYLSETAENYISIDSKIVNSVMNDYEKWSVMSSDEMGTVYDAALFDMCVYQIEKDLFKYIEEFNQE